MITDERMATTGVATAFEQYDSLLNRLEEMTAELIPAIENWDTDKVGELIDARSELCNQVGRSINQLSALLPRDTDDSPVLRRLEETIQRVREREQVVLRQQAEAERALSLELQRRRPELARQNEARSRQRAYRTPDAGHARFLDSKL